MGKYGAWSTIGLQFREEEQPWEGFVCGIRGSGEFTPPPPRVPDAGPSSIPPPVAAVCIDSYAIKFLQIRVSLHLLILEYQMLVLPLSLLLYQQVRVSLHLLILEYQVRL
ncbi:hypothetical protein Taro_036999 [Colocasia esculenta]|uniref:Uncharacterized protein n=1 Tax=Colocasia esculenta TaxID=4460 RepID=A0A843W8F6_COLES|nr:hypothetical protein [Colocasia esculenta]